MIVVETCDTVILVRETTRKLENMFGQIAAIFVGNRKDKGIVAPKNTSPQMVDVSSLREGDVIREGATTLKIKDVVPAEKFPNKLKVIFTDDTFALMGADETATRFQ